MKTEKDLAFIEWAGARHRWLWRLGFGKGCFKSNVARRLAQRSATMLMQADRLAWVAFVGR